MPILNATVTLTAKDGNGNDLHLSPQISLSNRGPIVQATISLASMTAKPLLEKGATLPNPITGIALIDTGASSTCIDDAAAQKLGLPVVDVVNMASASLGILLHA